MKRVVVIGVLVVLGVLLSWQLVNKLLLQRGKSDRPKGPRAVAVEIAPITRGAIRDLQVFTGSLIARAQVVVTPRVAARLDKLMVNIGDVVTPGQPLATLDDAEYARDLEQAHAEAEIARVAVENVRLNAALDRQQWAQQLAQAEAEVAIVKANGDESRTALTAAKREWDRAKSLQQSKIISDSEFEATSDRYQAQQAQEAVVQAQLVQKQALLNLAKLRLSETQAQVQAANVKNAEAQLARQEAAAKAAEIRLAYTRITAPPGSDGTRWAVGEKFTDEGTVLRVGDPIVSLLDTAVLTAVVYLPERDCTKAQVGQVAQIRTDAWPDRAFPGTLARIAPFLRESSREVRVELTVPNPEGRLKPGLFVRCQLEFAQQTDATLVPVSAIVRRAGQDGVLLADLTAKTARFVPIKAGLTDNEVTQVLEPALIGSVVTLGHHLLEDGSAISLPGVGGPAAAPGGKPKGAAGEAPAAGKRAGGAVPPAAAPASGGPR